DALKWPELPATTEKGATSLSAKPHAHSGFLQAFQRAAGQVDGHLAVNLAGNSWAALHAFMALAVAQNLLRAWLAALASPVAAVNFCPADQLGRRRRPEAPRGGGQSLRETGRRPLRRAQPQGHWRLSPERAEQRLLGRERYGHRPGGLERER